MPILTITRQRLLEQHFGKPIHKTLNDDILNEVKSYFINEELPEADSSWGEESKNKWLIEPDEKFNQETTDTILTITLSKNDSIDDFQQNVRIQLLNGFKKLSVVKKSITWNLKNENGKTLYIDSEGSVVEEINEWTDFKLEEMMSSIYSSMRILPYTENEIVVALTRYLTMMEFGIYDVIHDAEGIELEGGSVRGRGFCSSKKIKDALRDDHYSYIKTNKLKANGELDIRDLIFTARQIKSSFNFHRLVKLFVEDLIPSQAVIANEKLILLTNPMRVDIIGES